MLHKLEKNNFYCFNIGSRRVLEKGKLLAALSLHATNRSDLWCFQGATLAKRNLSDKFWWSFLECIMRHHPIKGRRLLIAPVNASITFSSIRFLSPLSNPFSLLNFPTFLSDPQEKNLSHIKILHLHFSNKLFFTCPPRMKNSSTLNI